MQPIILLMMIPVWLQHVYLKIVIKKEFWGKMYNIKESIFQASNKKIIELSWYPSLNKKGTQQMFIFDVFVSYLQSDFSSLIFSLFNFYFIIDRALHFSKESFKRDLKVVYVARHSSNWWPNESLQTAIA